ncbi:ThiF family adenylyltransferase (plasmid) [Hymenobacter volaticus]|uniref:ThiF family adenylyltransferase n=1 Tax=Hymenobacter volaticus TaxID=2932254 RepID=A0ABY4GGG8_9BACT|nr:ThiF family adenylyltransferase [Hymenobacter volaticus]
MTLEKTGNLFRADYARRNVAELLQNYRVASCHSEAFRDKDYHLRNSGRVSYELVREQAMTVIGCGALGSEIADSLGKAGVGRLKLLDNQTQYPHNSVRHLAGLHLATLPKAVAVAQVVADHNPFVKLEIVVEDILRGEFAQYMLPVGIGICSIADDNTEAYLNEQAVSHKRTIFYARALRGGKAARIFRVVPGIDACFHCLTLYRHEHHLDFIDVPEDTALPTLRNECNNPIRPASAADLKLIAAMTSRLLLDHLQNPAPAAPNHWVWTTETLPDLPENIGVPFSLNMRSLPPHPNCPYCQALHKLGVRIEHSALDFMRQLTLATPGIETGGILIGKVSAGLVHIQYASPPDLKPCEQLHASSVM